MYLKHKKYILCVGKFSIKVGSTTGSPYSSHIASLLLLLQRFFTFSNQVCSNIFRDCNFLDFKNNSVPFDGKNILSFSKDASFIKNQHLHLRCKTKKLNYFSKISVGQLFIFCHFFFQMATSKLSKLWQYRQINYK